LLDEVGSPADPVVLPDRGRSGSEAIVQPSVGQQAI